MEKDLDAFAKVLAILSHRARRQLVGLLLAMVAMALFEVLGIASILPFMAVAADPRAIHS